MRSLSPSACIPQVLSTCADQNHAGILLNTCLACPLVSILHTPLNEPSAQFCAASVITALGNLHMVCFLDIVPFSPLLLLCHMLITVNFFSNFLFEFQNGVLYRGVSPDVLMLDQTGYIQVALYYILCCIIFINIWIEVM